MIQLQTRDAYIHIEWEERDLVVRVFPKEDPESYVEFTEHQIENIVRAIRQVRTEQWITSKETGI